MKNKGSAKLGLEGGYRFEGGGAPCGVVIDLLCLLYTSDAADE